MREKLGLTLREVETQSRRIAQVRENVEYRITTGRLSHVENSNSLPSLYKLASLSEIYQTSYADLLRLYGIETGLASRPSDSNQDSPNAAGKDRQKIEFR
jgi:transcriptional regulator with XRE-family HTH domain